MPDVLDGTSDYLEEFVLRMVEAELEYTAQFKARLGPIDSVPYFFHHQTSFPYITHRLGEATPRELSSDMQERPYTFTGRFVVGHVGSDYHGKNELLIYRWLPIIETLYTRNIHLLSAKYPHEQLEGAPEQGSFVRDTGTRFFDNRGVSGLPNQVGFEFSVRGLFMIDIERIYSYPTPSET